jgi:glycosyltransferase involved in cell wall biosynthesis
MSSLTVLIPTARRPKMVARLLRNLLEQTRLPDEILVVDASRDAETAAVVEASKDAGGSVKLWRLQSPLGLTLQRSLGIDNTTGDLICMLDDDVLLEPDCLQVMEEFMNSTEGAQFGGVGAYITNEYGKEFYRYQRLYHRLALYDGELRPGRWLYCGDFLELSTLRPFSGVFLSEFLPAGASMYRRSVICETRPDPSFSFDGEDKHLTLRISQNHLLGVLGAARLFHDRVPGGVRKSKLNHAIRSMRNKAVILKECDSRPSLRRYLVFLVYQPLDLSCLTLRCLLAGHWRDLDRVIGSWVGWLWNLVAPPRASRRQLPPPQGA